MLIVKNVKQIFNIPVYFDRITPPKYEQSIYYDVCW